MEKHISFRDLLLIFSFVKTKIYPIIKKVFFVIFLFLIIINYLMASTKWFFIEHEDFWSGFKDLIWFSLPIINFFYVWDWWLLIFGVIIAIVILINGSVFHFFHDGGKELTDIIIGRH